MRKLLIIAATLVSCFAFPQEYLRPTADADAVNSAVCAGTRVMSSTMASVYTGKSGAGPITTASATNTQTGSPVNPYTLYKARIFSAWGAQSSAYTALTLNVNNRCTITTSADDLGGTCGVEYSLNSGSTWTTLLNSGTTTTEATATVTIAAGTDLTQLQVRVCAQGQNTKYAAPGTGALTVYDIWTTGIAAVTSPPSSYTVLAP